MRIHSTYRSLFLVPVLLASLITLFATATPHCIADSPAKRTAELESKLENDVALGTNTMTPMLFTALGSKGIADAGISLFTVPFMIGTRGDIQYQKMEGNAYRIRFDESEGAASVFFHFDHAMDLRNRWIRIAYSGRTAPEKVSVLVDPLDEKRSDARFPVYLERSDSAHDSFLKLPARGPFAKVKTLDFVIDPKEQKSVRGEFVLLDVQIMPKEFDPLKGGAIKPINGAPPKDLFQPDNLIPVAN